MSPASPPNKNFDRMEFMLALRRRGITDAAVLRAMDEVPREMFIPESMRAQAYQDHALPIECGQTISQPYVVAYMTELLELEPQHRVLEIGTGSGYQAAVISRIASGRNISRGTASIARSTAASVMPRRRSASMNSMRSKFLF